MGCSKGFGFFPNDETASLSNIFSVTSQPQPFQQEKIETKERLKPPDRSIKRIQVGEHHGEPYYAREYHETGHRDFEYGKVSKKKISEHSVTHLRVISNESLFITHNF